MSHAQNHQPLVSLVVPIYNVADYLEQCLASIQSQSYTNLEIICLNDGSTDSSLALLEAYAAVMVALSSLTKKMRVTEQRVIVALPQLTLMVVLLSLTITLSQPWFKSLLILSRQTAEKTR